MLWPMGQVRNRVLCLGSHRALSYSENCLVSPLNKISDVHQIADMILRNQSKSRRKCRANLMELNLQRERDVLPASVVACHAAISRTLRQSVGRSVLSFPPLLCVAHSTKVQRRGQQVRFRQFFLYKLTHLHTAYIVFVVV